jgi:hypothetical protein
MNISTSYEKCEHSTEQETYSSEVELGVPYCSKQVLNRVNLVLKFTDIT